MIRSSSRTWGRGVSAVMAASTMALVAEAPALAEVQREGSWPDGDPVVTLDLDAVPRVEAVNKLAAAAGWSIVVNAPKGDPVTVHVTKQPAGKVLELLLADGRYVARRDQSLIAISPSGAASPEPARAPLPPLPPVPPVPPIAAADDDDHDAAHADTEDAEAGDRFVTGHDHRVEKSDVVHDVTVMGGNLEVWGTVTGDVSVTGGNVTLHEGAHVQGDVAAVGGNVHVASGAAVDGDVGVFGGNVTRDEGSRISGEIQEGVHREKARGHHRPRRAARLGFDSATGSAKAGAPGPSTRGSLAHRAADALNGAALLFVFGAVLLALAPERMDRLKLQIASRPMRSFALGVVSLIGGVVLLAAMCVTIIGIPVAFVAALAAVLATLAAMCSVLETAGAALLGHRTRSPYVHLACGGLLFLLVGAIPFVGGLVKTAVILTAFGSVVATRAAGLVPARSRAATPYRDAPVT